MSRGVRRTLTRGDEGMKAWLVTWSAAGPAAEVADRIAAIWSSRLSLGRVAKMVEVIYALRYYDPSELAAVAARRRENPYPAHVSDGRISCGHNPSLYGRVVDRLVIEEDPNTHLETITWLEPPRYALDPDVDASPRVVQGPFPRGYIRQLSGPLSSQEVWDRANGRFKPGLRVCVDLSAHLPSAPSSKRRRTTA